MKYFQLLKTKFMIFSQKSTNDNFSIILKCTNNSHPNDQSDIFISGKVDFILTKGNNYESRVIGSLEIAPDGQGPNGKLQINMGGLTIHEACKKYGLGTLLMHQATRIAYELNSHLTINDIREEAWLFYQKYFSKHHGVDFGEKIPLTHSLTLKFDDNRNPAVLKVNEALDLNHFKKIPKNLPQIINEYEEKGGFKCVYQ